MSNAQPTSNIFQTALDLTEVAPEVFDQAFTAVPQYAPWPKAYGGDMVAQGAMAMMRSVDTDRTLHSMHSYFMRPVDMHEEVRYEIEHLRDGRGYSTRQVRGFQNGKAVYAGLGSFNVPVEGLDHTMPAPEKSLDLDPDALDSAEAALKGMDSAAAEYWKHGRSFDMRHVPGPVYMPAERDRTPHQMVWVKAFTKLSADPLVQKAALAYVCDYTILEPLLRTHGMSWGDPGLVTASLDHAMWFHREGRVDDWVLYAQDAVSAQDHRGLAWGRFYSREGRLLATVAQEGMIRATQ